MRSQQAIAAHRIKALQEGIKELNQYLSGIARQFHGKETLTAEEISTVRNDIDELQDFAGWLSQQ